jgi:hypothetical protein
MTAKNSEYQGSFDCVGADLRPSYPVGDWVSYASFYSDPIGADRIMVALISVYFDESGGTSDISPLTCSAAYVFKESGLPQFFREWEPYLKKKRLKYKGLDCFHAKDHCRSADSPEIFNTLRDLISRTSEQGFVRFALNGNLKKFNAKSGVAGLSGDNHALLTLATMEAVADYAKARDCKVISYIEDGPNDALQSLVNEIKADPSLKERYALSNISFSTKADAIQLQSADLLAWSFHRLDDTGRDARPLIDPAPGMSSLKEWRDWYKGHDLAGFDLQGLEARTLVNTLAGLRMPQEFLDKRVIHEA